MININEWVWVFDNSLMVCKNVENRIIVDIEEIISQYTGMPVEMGIPGVKPAGNPYI